jgi:RyR domain-containing protein/ATPase family protein associated with various cellular activities (AAA)
MKPTVLVTGDVVLDCHLYGGVKTAATSFSEPGTTYWQHVGGAALTCRLLHAASRAAGDAFATHFAFEEGPFTQNLPGHLRSYGVWTERPVRRGATPRVWRVDRHFGYGPTEPMVFDDIFKPATNAPADPALTILDDGGILFRHAIARGAWPRFDADSRGLYLLKMSSPLCRGDLWAALAPVLDRLIVVVSVDDLRRENLQISTRLSWEQTVEDTLRGLPADPIARGLLDAAHLIVNFRSAGALWLRRAGRGSVTRLVFDPLRMEGDFKRQIEGTTYGFQTTLAAGVACHLLIRAAAGDLDDAATVDAIEMGIAAGLAARRTLLEIGHGPIDAGQPGLPAEEIGKVLAASGAGYVGVDVAAERARAQSHWTIVAQTEFDTDAPSPLIGLALLVARYGTTTTLSQVPAFRLGRFFTIDRSEIESLRTLETLIRTYEDVKVQKKPLSIGVFGPPGAGKSFAVKALAKAVLGEKVPFLEFNLSQFTGPGELAGAFHRVRDAVLEGTTPVAFWDEFDSRHYEWLQYLLAPMQDGAFQEGQLTHPIGKCVFVFAGGTAPTLASFGVPVGESEDYRKYRLLKGPDFVSRLDGFLDVLGPNAREGTAQPDITWPVRRALTLRALLELKDDEPLAIDSGLLYALIAVPGYRHGVRSFERIVRVLARNRDNGRLHRSALPPAPALDRDTDATAFLDSMTRRDAYRTAADIDAIAAAIHRSFLEGAQRSALDARIQQEPSREWTIHPSVKQVYESLPPDKKAANRAAACRIPDHLALVGFVVVPRTDDDPSWKAALGKALERHLERLAQAEHIGWYGERVAAGWVPGQRDDVRKQHPLLVKWPDLGPADREKDRAFIRAIPELLEEAGYKAVPADRRR